MKQRKQCEKRYKYRRAVTAICNLLAVCLLILGGTYVHAKTVDLPPKSAIESSAVMEESTIQEETSEETLTEETLTEETLSEETSSEEESSVIQELVINKNTKNKTYSIKADANRMREPIQQTQSQITEKELQQTKKGNVDKTLILLICVTLLSTVLIYCSYTKIKLTSSISRKNFYNPKLKKRKKTRRSKKKRTVKEAKKWKRNSLQN